MRTLTPQERQFKALMRIWTALFAIGGLAFLLAGDWVITAGNDFASQVLHWDLPPMPPTSHSLWLILTTAMMATITVLCYWIQKDVVHHLHLTLLLLISKGTAAALFLVFFFLEAPFFNYLLGALVSDGPIFVITLIFYRRVLKWRQKSD